MQSAAETQTAPMSVIVTGAAHGIGRATALCLAGAGHRVGLLDLREPELAAVAAEITVGGGVATIYPCSVTDEAAVAQAMERHGALHGRIDALVNCAGIGLFASLLDTTPDDFRRIVEVNLTGTFVACRAALPWMLRQRSGSIINVASIAGKRAFPEQTAYCASKWGVLGFTRALAMEVRNAGVRVTALCPGAVNTPFWDGAGPMFDRSRMLQPEDVAATILFLLAQPTGAYVDEIEMTPPAGTL